jgi:hypothetical protein
MRVSEAMTRDVRIARPDQSIQDAAKMMWMWMRACCRWARTISSSA